MSKIVRVLILNATMKTGGAERVISLLLKEWSSIEDLQVHLILLESGLEYRLPKSILPLVLSNSKKTSVRKFFELPFISWRVARFINNNNIDVVVSFLYRPNYINLLAKKMFKTNHKVIINVRSTTSRYLKEGILGRVNLLLIRYLFNEADVIVSNSQGVEADLESLLDICTDKKVIHNPIDISHINICKKQCKNIEFDFNEGKIHIVSLGRLIPLKRNIDLIDAFYICQKKYKNIRLIFLGEGVLKNNLKEYCVKLNIESKVYFLGNVSNPFYYLSRSDLFVLSSEVEGFPNALLEAMACDLPVISSNCKSGPIELLDNGKYGMLYKVGDVSSLASKIDKLLCDQKLREYYSNMSKIRSKKFDLAKVLPKFTKLLIIKK
jgi:N-acetylgalactosamine-N,N'-diacetylbacillosaminyl-diphospho-undecaprenol 4-alpha-N-acetylgalactosaminyltransferase